MEAENADVGSAESGYVTPAEDVSVAVVPPAVVVREPAAAAVTAVQTVVTTVVKTVSEPVCETRTVISHGRATVCWVALLTVLQLAAGPVAALALETAAVTVCVTALLLAVVSQQLPLLLEWTGWEQVQ